MEKQDQKILDSREGSHTIGRQKSGDAKTQMAEPTEQEVGTPNVHMTKKGRETDFDGLGLRKTSPINLTTDTKMMLD